MNLKELALYTSERRYRRLFESAQHGMLILDGETGEIIDANPFLLDLLHYHFRDLIGFKLWEIGRFKDIAASKQAFKKLREKMYLCDDSISLVLETARRYRSSSQQRLSGRWPEHDSMQSP